MGTESHLQNAPDSQDKYWQHKVALALRQKWQTTHKIKVSMQMHQTPKGLDLHKRRCDLSLCCTGLRQIRQASIMVRGPRVLLGSWTTVDSCSCGIDHTNACSVQVVHTKKMVLNCPNILQCFMEGSIYTATQTTYHCCHIGCTHPIVNISFPFLPQTDQPQEWLEFEGGEMLQQKW